MASPTIYASFLVRLWREHNLERCPELAEGRYPELAEGRCPELAEGQPESTVDCCSEVEHIQSGQRWSFGSLDEMLDFLRQQAGALEVSSPPTPDSGRVRASSLPERESDEQPKANHEKGGV